VIQCGKSSSIGYTHFDFCFGSDCIPFGSPKFVGEAIIIESSSIALSVLLEEDVQEYFVLVSHWPRWLLWGTPLPRRMFI
jgi:hypothetical protein